MTYLSKNNNIEIFSAVSHSKTCRYIAPAKKPAGKLLKFNRDSAIMGLGSFVCVAKRLVWEMSY